MSKHVSVVSRWCDKYVMVVFVVLYDICLFPVRDIAGTKKSADS